MKSTWELIGRLEAFQDVMKWTTIDSAIHQNLKKRVDELKYVLERAR